jgi:hypothetical protein
MTARDGDLYCHPSLIRGKLYVIVIIYLVRPARICRPLHGASVATIQKDAARVLLRHKRCNLLITLEPWDSSLTLLSG